MENITKREALAETLTRREVAVLLELHPDSITRLLSEGLASAVIRWGGRGKEMAFSRALVLRWDAARTCHNGAAGGPCGACRLVLEDGSISGRHVQAAQHGVFERCKAPGCGIQRAFCPPCGWPR